jgi:hypothetical protein
MELEVETGSVAVLRLYDVANAIDLARAERAAAAGAPTRIQLTHVKPKALAFGEAPVEIGLGRADVPLGGAGTAHAAEISARIYDFGAVTLSFRFRARGLTWPAYVDLVDGVNAAFEDAALWTAQLERVCGLIKPAMDRPTPAGVQEDYLVATVQRFDRLLPAEQVLAQLDVAGLLSGERRALSPAAREELLRNRFSYYTDDLVVLTWDRAFIVEPDGDSDVADVLEVANAQLLELRYYDTLLDAELPRMYERVEQARRAFRGLARRRYAHLARELYTRVAEVTEIAERVDNALIVTEDVYLARIYGAALDLFRVHAWNAAVERKLAIMRDTCAALYDEAATGRAEVLELAIVLLIVVEIVLALIV